MEVNHKKCKNALEQMFLVKLSFSNEYILVWVKKKYKLQHLEIDLLTKNKYERDNPINQQKDKGQICNFPLKIEPLRPEVPNPEMS